MSTGGVFQLITNDGKQDRMLMATQMLRNRLDAIRAKRRADPTVQDETPTLLDIERTHVLFTNAHFKPFVALGYEYNKVNAGTGTVQLGGDVQFSIPQFGDFFNDMVLAIQLSAPTLTHNEIVPANIPTARWTDFPGERLLKKVSFEVNGNPLDQYTNDATVMHRKFLVQPNKEVGWYRCMGQQLPIEAELNPDQSGSPDDHRVQLKIVNGPQVPQDPNNQQSLNLMVPLLFWCNTDPRLAIPSVAIPYGQRFINVTLATAAEMVGVQIRGGGNPLTTTLSTPMVSNMNLYINNIFVNPEIHKIFIKRIGFTLIRVHRQQVISTSLADQEILLQNLKWPIETLFLGLRPVTQKTSLRDWHKFTQITETPVSVSNIVTSASTGVVDTTATASTTNPVKFTFQEAQATALVSTKTIDRITISAHGIYLYNDIPADFFNYYTTYTYGGPHIRTPWDEGALMIPFNLYPGTYQPSGHVNVSRAREFYIRFTSSVIGVGAPTPVAGEMSITASAINFLKNDSKNQGEEQYYQNIVLVIIISLLSNIVMMAKPSNCGNLLKL